MSEEAQGMDEELRSLLDDLQSPSEPVSNDVLDTSVSVAPDIIPDPILSDPVDLEQAELSPSPSPQIVSTISDAYNINSIVSKFDSDYGEVQSNLKRDRKKIDDVINILLQRVRNNADAETDTMSLVKALAVLADTNGHAVKLLDSRSKLLSATKSTINANQINVNTTGNDAELQRILSQSGDE